MLKVFSLVAGLGMGFALAGFVAAPPAWPTPRQDLPADLPQAKLLFVKYAAAELPVEGPTGWGAARARYFVLKNHNKAIPDANRQLAEAARRYPFACRVTVADSVAYYRDQQGYKYQLMHDAFEAGMQGQYVGTNESSGQHYTPSFDLYVQELATGTKYVFEDFGGPFVYAYKWQVELLLKKISKQFNTTK